MDEPTGHSVTSLSLLSRVRSDDSQAWSRLVDLYSPLVFMWCRRANLSVDDTADVMQETFRAVARKVKDFRREQPGDSFRGWLFTITKRKIQDHFRGRAQQPVAPGGSQFQQRLADLPDVWADPEVDDECRSEMDVLRKRALEQVRAEFQPQTWQAFWKTTIDEISSGDVATELGMSVGAVYKAKSRVLARLRVELLELEDPQ